MKGKGPRLSAGTILTLFLTAAVVAGCVFVFAKIRGGNPENRMSAQQVIGLVGDALQGTTPAPLAPQSTVRTVTVTLAPTAMATAVPVAPLPTQYVPQVPNENHSFSLTVGGLLCFQSDISDAVYDKNTKVFNYSSVLSPLQQKVTADLNLVMLPQVVNTVDQKYADTLAPAAALDAVKAAGFDDVLLNTSHILDQDVKGAVDTVAAMAGRGLSAGGVNASTARQHRMIQLNGIRIALLAYTDTLTQKGKLALQNQPDLLQLFHTETARKDIQDAKNQGAECVIVMMYWGKDDATSVTTAQRNTAQALAEMGADLILGYRPTRVLPMEWIHYAEANGVQHQALAVYSLGTLLSESRDGYDISGLLLHLDISCRNGQVQFNSVEYTPTYIWRQSINGKMQYQVICSSDPAPEAMNAKQKEIMGKALSRIKNILKNSPIEQR